jgi:small nuclear ribonucleoprotein G
LDKKLFVQLNGQRAISGILRGYDPWLNLVLDDVHEESVLPGTASASSKESLGSVVS